MNILLQKCALTPTGAGLRSLVFVLSAAFLASCGGDSGVDIGSGQSADPVAIDYPLFYVKRPLPMDGADMLVQTDVREILPTEFGADLYMKARASVSTPEVNLTGGITGGLGDVRDVSVSHDGTRLLFSMRAPIDPDADDEDQPTWDIWEYDIGAEALRPIMGGLAATEGHDIGAQYLPDGRIVFSSTRQNQSLSKLSAQGRAQFSALDENQNEPAFVLHVMDDDGANLEQISFNQSHDLYPTVLDNGRVMFSRWDSMGGLDSISLYSVNPDGTDLQLLYGADSHDTGTLDSTVQFIKPKEMQSGSVVALLAPFTGTSAGGDLVVIDTNAYINNTQPNINNGGATGPAQQPTPRARPVFTIPGISPGGRYTAVWPLWDGTNRAFVSWTNCRYQTADPASPIRPCDDRTAADPQAVEAMPAYSIYVYDFSTGNLSPILLQENGLMFTDVVVAQARSRTPVWIPDQDDAGTADASLAAEQAGILHIRSVYDIDGVDTYGYAVLADPAATSADARPARFIRVYKATAIPDEETLDFDNSAFGVTRAFGMREIIGYAPVEPDGSVMVKVPADVPLAIDVLDSQGRRLPGFPRHQNWLQVRPGEVRECSGCHDSSAPGISHGRSDSFAVVNSGAPFSGYIFPNTALGTSSDTGETMAATRARYCSFPSAGCNSLDMSISLVYEDVWTAAPLTPDPVMPAILGYDGLDGVGGLTDFPEFDATKCLPWTVDCRVIINYQDHIQPLWEVARDAIDPDPLATVNSCVSCHALADAAGVLINPDDRGQLELTKIPSEQDATQYKSYRELLSGDTREVLDGGAIIQDTQIRRDGAGNPVLDINDVPIEDPIGVAAPLSIAGAAARPLFFDRFVTDMGTVSHNGWLSEAELLLIAEWLDLGAQYFNNPFHPDVPPG